MYAVLVPWYTCSYSYIINNQLLYTFQYLGDAGVATSKQLKNA